MILQRLFRKPSGGKFPRAARPRPRSRRLVLEALESRLAPTVNWISTQSGDWGKASNWSTGAVPGSGDDVVINQNTTGLTVTIASTEAATCHSITTTANNGLDLNGGSLTIAKKANIGGLCTLETGPQGRNPTFLITGKAEVLAGYQLNVTGTLDLKAGTITVNAANIGAFLLIEGGTVLQEGGTISVGYDVKITGGDAQLDINGTLDIEAGTLSINGPVTLNTPGILKGSSLGTLEVGGNQITQYTPPQPSKSDFPGTLLLDGTGNTGTPQFSTHQLLLAMSTDYKGAGGFRNNFVFGTIKLANNTAVAVSQTTFGNYGDAVYVDNLIVTSGSVFNVNGGIVYAKHTQIDGTVVGGQIKLQSGASSTTTVSWISNQSGDWGTASNWSTGVVPGAYDNVVINQAGSITVTVSSADVGLANSLQLSAGDSLALTGGSLTVLSSSEIDGTCLVSSGDSTLTVNGNLNVNGTLDLEAGITSINGNLDVGASSGSAIFEGSFAATLAITGSLTEVSAQTSGPGFAGTVLWDGNGWFADAAQYLQMPSQDINAPSGFQNNFAFGSLVLANTTMLAVSSSIVYADKIQTPPGSMLSIDRNGPPFGSSNPNKLYAEAAQIQGTLDIIGDGRSSHVTIIPPGSLSLATSNVSIADADLELGEPTTVTLIARDGIGNPEISGGSTVIFRLGSGSGGGTFSAVTDKGDGTYTATFTATTLGTNTITATIDGQAVTSTPPTFTVVLGPASLSQSAVSLQPSSIQAGGATAVTLTARNAYGYQETSGGLAVAFGVGAGSPGGVFSAFTDNGDGTYTARFSTSLVGSDLITATIGGQTVTSTLPTLIVTPGPVSLSQSTVSVAKPILGAGSTTTVTLTALDAYGNQESSGGLTVAFGLAPGSAGGTFGAVTDHGDGTYTVSLTAGIVVGNDTITAMIGGQPVTSVAPTLSVTPAKLILVALAKATTHTAVSLTVVAVDAFGNTVTGYTGTVHFSSSDPKAVLPAAYAFQATDAGRHNFTMTFGIAGTQIVAVTDAVSGLTAQQTFAVSPGDLNLHFLDQLYEQLLHRVPDGFGEQYWWLFLLGGGTREQVVQGFLQSMEYNTNRINSLYESILGRMPDPTGLHDFLNLLTSPPAPGADPVVQFESALLGSAEFYQKVGGTNNAFLHALYVDVLGRDIDPTGAAAWAAALAQGQSRTAVAQQVLTTAEADQDFVQAYYPQFLGRAADTGGLNSFVAALLARARRDEVIVGVLASDEYFNRF